MTDQRPQGQQLPVVNRTPPDAPGNLVLEDEGRSPPSGDVDPEQLRSRLISALRGIYDPEIPVNIYDLGLVYELSVDDAGSVLVKMSLTAPGCPVADQILSEVHAKLRATADVARVVTELVWDPPWSPERMSQAVKLELGLL
jgi:FeS assembly SUF system protein